jgi:hypothetical protein
MKELVENIKEKLVPDTDPHSFWINGAIQECVEIIQQYREDLFSELRGLLKEHAQFPKEWDTNQRLIDWLKEKGEYQ